MIDLNRLKTPYFLLAAFLFLLAANYGTIYWADDYCRVFHADQNLLETVLLKTSEEYFRNTGRLAVSALTYLFINSAFPEQPLLFNLLNSTIFILLTVGIFRLARGALPGIEDGAGLLVIFFLIWHGTSAIGEAALWKTGAIGYLWVVTAGIWLMIPFTDCALHRKIESPHPGFILGAPFLVLLCGLGLENFTGAVFLAQSFAILVAFRRNIPRRPLATLVAIATLTGIALVFLVTAPGSHSRAEYVRGEVGETGGFLSHALEFTKSFFIFYLRSWLLYVFAFLLWKVRDRQTRIAALAFFALSLICCFALIAAPGIQIGARRNFACETFLIIAIFILSAQAMRSTVFTPKIQSRIHALILAITCISSAALLLFNHAISVTEQQRQALIATARKNGEMKTLVLPRLEIPLLGSNNTQYFAKRMFFIGDIIGGPGNNCIAQSYRLNDLIVEISK